MAFITIITIRNPTTDRIFINVTNHIVVVLLIIITTIIKPIVVNIKSRRHHDHDTEYSMQHARVRATIYKPKEIQTTREPGGV